MRAAALIAFALIVLCPPARAQQNVPAVQADKLIDRLYPGNSKEIERRLATSATLTATPLAPNRPASAPGPLILRIRRAQSTNRVTSPGLSARTTTQTLAAAGDRPSTRSLNHPTTTTTIRNAAGRTATGEDLQKYLGSLKQAPSPVLVSPANQPGGAAVSKRPPVAVPVDQLGPMINVNRASQAELERALKLDPQRARLIIEFRTSQGRIHSPDDLAQVNGITGDMILKWEKQAVLKFD